ncbi:MAG: nucleotidyltransferase domain-containing protein [Candidatus Muiribacteriota bacterium]
MADKIMHWFFAFPDKEFTLTEIVRNLKVSKTTANKELRKLQREGFLQIETIGNLWRVSCNQKHEFNTTKKIPYNLSLVYQSGIIKKIQQKYPGARAIILFGSYRKGDDISSSDLDIAVEILDTSTEIKNFTKLSLGFRRNVSVNLTVFSRKQINTSLFTNIANGIVLKGFLEVKP